MTGSSTTSTGSSRTGVCSIWLLGLTTIFLALQADRCKTNRTQLVAKRLFIIRFIVCSFINVYTPKILYILLSSLAKRMILAVCYTLGGKLSFYCSVNKTGRNHRSGKAKSFGAAIPNYNCCKACFTLCLLGLEMGIFSPDNKSRIPPSSLNQLFTYLGFTKWL